MDEHAVLICLQLNGGGPDQVQRIFDLEDRIEQALVARRVGELDGDEFGADDCTIFTYGPDADTLFAAIEPVVRSFTAGPQSRVIVRYGGPGAPERVVPI